MAKGQTYAERQMIRRSYRPLMHRLSALQRARRLYGKDAQEGNDFNVYETANGRWDVEAGPKYESLHQINGKQDMTPRMREVWGLIAEGLRNKEIAQRLQIAEKTVKAHATAVYKELGAESSRTKAALMYYQRKESKPTGEWYTQEEPVDPRADHKPIASNE